MKAAWKRLCAGEYRADGGWSISRVEQHPHYGGGFMWVMYKNDLTGDVFDPLYTLAECKSLAERVC